MRVYRVAPLAGSVDRNPAVTWCSCLRHVAPLAGSVDRNLVSKNIIIYFSASLPSRGAWIEIKECSEAVVSGRVAPLAGSVDRNMTPEGRLDTELRRSPRGERG